MTIPAEGLSLDVPFLNLLGVKLHLMEQGTGEVRLEVDEKHHNTWGIVHGGVLLTLVDAAMAIAARAADPDDRSVVTIELKNTFMASAQGHLKVIGKIIQRTPTMAFCEARAFDSKETLVCMATGTFKYFKKLPTRDASGNRVVNQDQRSI